MSEVALGLITPVLTLLQQSHARWEEHGTIAEVARIVGTADALGYDFVTCSEHVAIPTDTAEVRGGRYWDPLATFGYLAATTTRIRFATYVLVLGYHHPLDVAKRYGTLDRLSVGRLVLGLGVGSLEGEFALLGAQFAGRGAIADDALRALRAALSDERPSYAGDHFAFDDVVVDPCAVQARVPIWVGGRSRRSLRRAVELGDGWAPFGVTAGEVSAWLAEARSTEAWAGRAAPLEVVLQPSEPLDPAGEPAATLDTFGALVDVGVTHVALRLVHHSADHCIEQVEAMAELTRQ